MVANTPDLCDLQEKHATAFAALCHIALTPLISLTTMGMYAEGR